MDTDIDKLIYEYKKMKAIEAAEGFLMNRTGRNLDETEKRLSIIERKRRLGLPVSDDDYEEATNEGKSFYSRVAPSAGKYGLQAIPNPKFLDPGGHGAFFKVAHQAERKLPSMLFGLPIGAAKHGKPISGIGKFFGW